MAIVIEYTAPAAGFFAPGLGRSATRDWHIEGSHLAERCGLFIIIALGESILVTGATFARLDWAPVAAASFVLAFAVSIAMWWIYFNIGAEPDSKHTRSSDPGRVGRIAHTYLHLLLVGGIILAALGDELVLEHPLGHVKLNTIIAVVAGPAQSPVQADHHRALAAVPSHWLALLALVALLAPFVTPLALSFASTVALVAAAAWETRFSRKDHVEA
jgi:low temperature requirement protein LtrA